MYPGLKIVLVGLGAAGRAGKASARLALTRAFVPVTIDVAVDVVARDGSGELRAPDDDVAHGVCPGFAPIRLDEAVGRAGNGLLDDASTLR